MLKKYFIRYSVCILFIFVIQTTQVAGMDKNESANWTVFSYGKNNIPSYAVLNINIPVSPVELEAAFIEIKQTSSTDSNTSNIGVGVNVISTIELAYQIKDLATYFIACQETKDENVWTYKQFVDALPINPNNCDQKTFACRLVQSYGDCYRKTDEDFALSAIDLSKISDLINNIKNLIQAVTACEKFDASIKNSIKQAAQNSISFNVTDYIDLNSFYTQLLIQISKIKTNDAIKNLLAIINSGRTLANAAVFSRVCGGNVSGACGLSIYYPKSANVTQDSYLKTEFEKETSWLNFISQYR